MSETTPVTTRDRSQVPKRQKLVDSRDSRDEPSVSIGSGRSIPVRPPNVAFSGGGQDGGLDSGDREDEEGGYTDLDEDGGWDASDHDAGGGRWLALENQGWGGSSPEVFWDPGAHGTAEPDSPLPSEWADFTRVERPTSGMVVDGETQGRVPRGTRIAVPYARFRQLVGGSRQARSGSTYNPFGRFSTEKKLAVVPLTGKHAEISGSLPDAIQSALDEIVAAEAAVLVTPKETPARDRDGRWPPTIATTADDTLHLSMVTPFAVLYSSEAGKERATSTGLGSPLVEGVATTSGLLGLRGEDVDSHSGKKRSSSQEQVKGGSAGAEASALGFPVDGENRWEWLHLVAHSMGGATVVDGRPVEVQDAQVPENLVLGTREANTEMIVAEESIKSLTKKYKIKADVVVSVRYRDEHRRVPEEIKYDYSFWHTERDHPERRAGLGVFMWSFDPMRRTEPTASGHRFVRATMSALGRLMEDAGEERYPELSPEELARKRQERDLET